MKSFLRATCAALLCACLLTFTLWRYSLLPDLSGISNWLKSIKAQADELKQATDDLIEGITGGQGSSAPARPVESGDAYSGYTPTEEIEGDLLTVICNAYDQHLESVDLSAFELTADELKTVVSSVRYSCPEYFYVANTYSYSSNAVTGLINDFCPSYLVDAEAAALQTEIYGQVIAEIVAGAPADGTDFEKVLYLHDYFVRNYCYDYTYTIRDAYTFFEEGTGVCQAYMLAFIATAEALGIRSIPVTSNEMNHAWNLVEVDGVWYHMDITWDDTGSYASFTSYAYFLQSDSGIHNYDVARTDDPAEIHHDWIAAERAEDTRYDGAVWRTSNAPIVVANGGYYCTVPAAEGAGGFLFGGADPTDLQQLQKIDGIWRVQGTNSYYPGCYSGLALLGNELIYNTDKTLRAYDITTGKDRLLGIPALRQTQSLYGVCSVNTETRELTIVVAEILNDEHVSELLFTAS